MSEVPEHNLQSQPAAGQAITHQGTTYTTVKEGLAYILVPPNARTAVDPKAQCKSKTDSDQAQNVFYNPIQQFNRDLSVLAIKAFGEDLCDKRQRVLAQRKERPRKRRQVKESGNEEGVKRRKVDNEHAIATEKEDVAAVTTSEGLHDNENEQFDLQQDGESAQETNGVGTILNGGSTANAGLEQNEEAGTSNLGTPRFRILDALSATGLRALRYAQEIPFATHVTANDLLSAATAAIQLNVQHNKLTSRIKATTSNAMAHMYNAGHSLGGHDYARYDVIDLDPYGTAAPFLDAAIQAINDNGLLCVTCTDAGVWASCGYVEKTYSQYGGLPLKGPHSHEAGLRLILHSIASTAARYGLAIEPLLSLSIDFYARVFVRVKRSPADVKFLAGKTMLVNQCDSGCGAWSTQMLARNKTATGPKGGSFFKYTAAQTTSNVFCDHCGSKTHVAGPMWGGPLHNPYFIERILSGLPTLDRETYVTKDRVEGMLTSALDELDVLEMNDTGEATTDSTANGDTDNAAASWQNPSSNQDSLIPSLPSRTQEHHPFFFIPSALAKVLHCQAPSEAAIKGAIRHAGYRATRSHTKPGCIKTNASWAVIWEIMREWVRQRSPVKEGAIKANTAGAGIMKNARKVQEAAAERDAAVDANGQKGEMVNGDGKKDKMNIDVRNETLQDGEVGEKAQDAPPTDNEIKLPTVDNGDAGKSLAGKKPVPLSEMKVVFDEQLGKDKRGKRLLRYQLNPRANWGPMSRAKG